MEKEKEAKKQEEDKKEDTETDKKEDNEEKEDTKTNKHQEKQARLLLLFLVGIVVISIIVAFLIAESKKYDYNGITFKEELFGEIPIHTAHLTGFNVFGEPLNFKLNLRNDPRENNIPSDDLNFILSEPIFLSINMTSNIDQCGAVPLVSLGQFMDGVGFNLITGVSTFEKAGELKRAYFNCDTLKDSTVLFLTESDVSEIKQTGDNCYELRVNNCELLEVIEKFEISTLKSLSLN